MYLHTESKYEFNVHVHSLHCTLIVCVCIHHIVNVFNSSDLPCSKGDFDGAIAQYILTIGKLEPSYVIRKVGGFCSNNIGSIIDVCFSFWMLREFIISPTISR